MQPQLQRSEIEAARRGDDDFAVEPAARALHRAADRELMGALVAEGIDGADRLVGGLNSKGHRFVLRERAQDRRMWMEELDGGKRAFEIRAVANRFNRLAAVRYVA